MNEQYLQTVAPLHISKLSNCVGGYHYKSDKEIPKFIDLHYGKGSFPLKELLKFVPDGCKVTNEAKRNIANTLEEVKIDSVFLKII